MCHQKSKSGRCYFNNNLFSTAFFYTTDRVLQMLRRGRKMQVFFWCDNVIYYFQHTTCRPSSSLCNYIRSLAFIFVIIISFQILLVMFTIIILGGKMGALARQQAAQAQIGCVCMCRSTHIPTYVWKEGESHRHFIVMWTDMSEHATTTGTAANISQRQTFEQKTEGCSYCTTPSEN